VRGAIRDGARAELQDLPRCGFCTEVADWVCSVCGLRVCMVHRVGWLPTCDHVHDWLIPAWVSLDATRGSP
jgi:hypothetical protein